MNPSQRVRRGFRRLSMSVGALGLAASMFAGIYFGVMPLTPFPTVTCSYSYERLQVLTRDIEAEAAKLRDSCQTGLTAMDRILDESRDYKRDITYAIRAHEAQGTDMALWFGIPVAITTAVVLVIEVLSWLIRGFMQD